MVIVGVVEKTLCKITDLCYNLSGKQISRFLPVFGELIGNPIDSLKIGVLFP